MTLALATLAALSLPAPSQDLIQSQRSLDGALTNASFVQLADLNGDGLDDLILISDRFVRVSVAMRESLDSFALPSVEIDFSLIGIGEPAQAKTRDLDGDGNLDIVVASSRSLYSALGDGAGGFAAPRSHGPMDTPAEIDVADVDSDGFLDVVIGSPLAYLPGSASGFVSGRTPILAVGASAIGLATGDFDGDGFVDIAARILASGGVPGGARVLWGDGSGQFSVLSSTPVPINALSFQAADLDADGDLDLLGLGANLTRVNLIQNLGGRAFGPALVFDGNDAVSAEIADLDSDGLPEIILRSQFASATRVMPNAGAFQIGAPASAGDARAIDGAVTDLNSDGIMDAVHAERDINATVPGRIRALTGSRSASGEIRFDPAQPIDEQFASQFTVVPMDANLDGIDDLVIWDGEGDVFLKIGLGEGNYDAGVALTTLGQSSAAPTVGDFTGDGINDLVTCLESSNELVVAPGDGTGGFGSAATLAQLGEAAAALVAADFDADGFDDVAWIDGISVGYAFGSPLGLSAPWIAQGAVTRESSLRVDDLDGDGTLDLLLTSENRIAAAFQQPGQSYAPFADLYSGPLRGSAITIDLDRDGIRDIAFGRYDTTVGSEQISWLQGQGGGMFLPPQSLFPASNLSRFEVVDLTGDGAEDLAWTDNGAVSNRGIFWAENLPGGTMSSRRSIDSFFYLRLSDLTAVLDVDGDGDQDLLTTLFGWVPALAVAENTLFGPLGEGVCTPIVANSTGREGQLTANGSTDLSLNQLSLTASDLPVGAFGFFLTSRQAAVVQNVPGSVGTLCLANPIGRFSAPSQIRQADASGSFQLDVDVNAIPTPSAGLISIVPGDTWVFQAWHRDTAGGSAVSNFTQAVRVAF